MFLFCINLPCFLASRPLVRKHINATNNTKMHFLLCRHQKKYATMRKANKNQSYITYCSKFKVTSNYIMNTNYTNLTNRYS